MKPASTLHLEKARSSYLLYRMLRDQRIHPDWAVTVLFYTALHLSQTYFVETASSGFVIPRDHAARDTAVAARLPDMFESYRYLATRSQWARYQVDKPIPSYEAILRYEHSHFDRIVSALTSRGVALIELREETG